MAEFKVYEPSVEVLGEVVAAFIAGFPQGTEKVGLGILERQGIKDPRLGEWYPLQSFLDAMQEISQNLVTHMLTRIEEKIAINAKLPSGLDSLEKCLESIDVAYHMNHRGGEIGSYTYSRNGSPGGLQQAKMVCTNCYPCTFDLGVLEGFSQRFKPKDAAGVVVRHDDSQPCRRKGDDSCVYIISWA